MGCTTNCSDSDNEILSRPGLLLRREFNTSILLAFEGISRSHSIINCNFLSDHRGEPCSLQP